MENADSRIATVATIETDFYAHRKPQHVCLTFLILPNGPRHPCDDGSLHYPDNVASALHRLKAIILMVVFALP